MTVAPRKNAIEPYELNYKVTLSYWNKETSEEFFCMAIERIFYIAMSFFMAVCETIHNAFLCAANAAIWIINDFVYHNSEHDAEIVVTETKFTETRTEEVPPNERTGKEMRIRQVTLAREGVTRTTTFRPRPVHVPPPAKPGLIDRGKVLAQAGAEKMKSGWNWTKENAWNLWNKAYAYIPSA